MKTVGNNYHSMLLFYYPKLIIQTGLDCWIGYVLYAYANALDFVLSDDTLVKSTTWKELKLYAMQGNYSGTNWYKKLNEED